LRRLFSTFAPGWPGAGLLLRFPSGIVVINRGLRGMANSPSAGMVFVDILMMAAGVLLLAGLWTPVSGSLTAAAGFWAAVSQARDLEAASSLIRGGLSNPREFQELSNESTPDSMWGFPTAQSVAQSLHGLESPKT